MLPLIGAGLPAIVYATRSTFRPLQVIHAKLKQLWSFVLAGGEEVTSYRVCSKRVGERGARQLKVLLK